MLEGGAAKLVRKIAELATDFVKAARPSSIIQRTTTEKGVAQKMIVFLASSLTSRRRSVIESIM